jgi:hypothetical protein
MAGRADFTEQEWNALRKGVTGAALLVSTSDRSFFDTFKEAGALSKHLAAGRSESSELVRELSAERGTGFSIGTSPQELESEALGALQAARSILETKAPEELDAYRAFVVEVAQAVASSAGGGEEAEGRSLERIKSVLDRDGTDTQPPTS